MNRRKRF